MTTIAHEMLAHTRLHLTPAEISDSLLWLEYGDATDGGNLIVRPDRTLGDIHKGHDGSALVSLVERVSPQSNDLKLRKPYSYG